MHSKKKKKNSRLFKKPVVVKYREAKTSYAAAVKKTLPTPKNPTTGVQNSESSVKELREKTDNMMAQLKNDVTDLQKRLEEGLYNLTKVVATLTEAANKNEKNYNNMAIAITSLVESVKRMEATIDLGRTTSTNRNNNTGQS